MLATEIHFTFIEVHTIEMRKTVHLPTICSRIIFICIWSSEYRKFNGLQKSYA